MDQSYLRSQAVNIQYFEPKIVLTEKLGPNFFGGFVCYSNPTSSRGSPFGSVLCVPSYTSSSPAFKGVTHGESFLLLLNNNFKSTAEHIFVHSYIHSFYVLK